MNTAVQPQTPAEQDEADYGEHVIWRLTGAQIVAIGGNEKGEIFLSVRKAGQVAEFVIGVDTDYPSGVALYEIERKEVPA
jgi:hypothetical protein